MKRLVLIGIRAYQVLLSPVLPPSCRFTPTCSQFTHEAVARFGVLRGGLLGLRRLLKCHPFHPAGFDPVPDASASQAIHGSRAAQRRFPAACARLKETSC